ncbi:hypothetical protein [Sulfurimonas sp.]
MVIIDDLYHGTDKYFSNFVDKHLGTGSGTGYIKAHWFAKGGDKVQRAAKLFAEQRGINKKHYIYKTQLKIKKDSIVRSYDDLDKKLNLSQIETLESKSSNFQKNMTFEDFIHSNDNAYNLLIDIDIVVITGWTPDNGLCDEYIALLTATKNDLCTIKIELI